MNFRHDPRVRRFAEAARIFRKLIEDDECKEQEFVRALFPALAELYAAGAGLEQVDVDELPENDLPAAKLSEGVLADKMGPCEDPIDAKVRLDLAELYADIVPGLKAYESIDLSVVSAAVWHWQFGFSTHWGAHAISAMRVMHRRVMQRGWPQEFLRT